MNWPLATLALLAPLPAAALGDLNCQPLMVCGEAGCDPAKIRPFSVDFNADASTVIVNINNATFPLPVLERTLNDGTTSIVATNSGRDTMTFINVLSGPSGITVFWTEPDTLGPEYQVLSAVCRERSPA